MSIDFHSRLDEEQHPPLTQQLTLWQTWFIQSVCLTDMQDAVLPS